MMKREVKPIGWQVTPVNTESVTTNLSDWFQRQPSVGEGNWFLAHADDGVIWGQIRNGQLIVSASIFPTISPPLRTITLQQARLFGEQAEVRLWRQGDSFSACRLQDHADENAAAFDEEHLLWGTQIEEQKGDFTLVAEGRQGLRHAVPLRVAAPALSFRGYKHPLSLWLRHYLADDDDGQVYVRASRLVALRG